MRKLIVLFSLVLSVNANAALSPLDKAEFLGRNILNNPGFESGKSQWSASGGTFATTTSSPLEGSAMATWDSNAASQTLTSTAVAIPVGMRNQSGVVSCRMQCASGTCTHTITVDDGTTNIVSPVTITSATTGGPRTNVTFTFPTSGNIRVKISSINANEPQLNIEQLS